MSSCKYLLKPYFHFMFAHLVIFGKIKFKIQRKQRHIRLTCRNPKVDDVILKWQYRKQSQKPLPLWQGLRNKIDAVDASIPQPRPFQPKQITQFRVIPIHKQLRKNWSSLIRKSLKLKFGPPRSSISSPMLCYWSLDMHKFATSAFILKGLHKVCS